jgi:putative tryptophan/tyrosine transport system substrate-binding protein
MRRREFILLVGATAAVPFATLAQTVRRIGLLFATSLQAAKARGLLDAINQGLKEYGWVDGQNIAYESRFADNRDDELPRLAAELVGSRVDLILTDSTPGAAAARNATRTIPIVAVSNDPVASGLVSSLSRPGANVTGISYSSAELAGRRLQLLGEMVVGLARVSVLLNPANPSHFVLLKQTQAAAQSLKIELHVAEARSPDLLDGAFAAITAAQSGAIIVLPGAMFLAQSPDVVAFAAKSRLPTMFPWAQNVESGGLMSYSPSLTVAFRRTAAYVDKIFRGANPGDLPVETPTTFELVINLKIG